MPHLLIYMVNQYLDAMYPDIEWTTEIDDSYGNMVTIHVLSYINDFYENEEMSYGHTETFDWYTVDRTTGIGTTIMGETINFNEYQNIRIKEGKICTNCGKTISDEMDFCINCGHKIEK